MGETLVPRLRRGRGGTVHHTLDVGDGLQVFADTGCDWARFDARFGRCLTCPLLAGCRYDLPPWEQRWLEAQLVAGKPPASCGARGRSWS